MKIYNYLLVMVAYLLPTHTMELNFNTIQSALSNLPFQYRSVHPTEHNNLIVLTQSQECVIEKGSNKLVLTCFLSPCIFTVIIYKGMAYACHKESYTSAEKIFKSCSAKLGITQPLDVQAYFFTNVSDEYDNPLAKTIGRGHHAGKSQQEELDYLKLQCMNTIGVPSNHIQTILFNKLHISAHVKHFLDNHYRYAHLCAGVDIQAANNTASPLFCFSPLRERIVATNNVRMNQNPTDYFLEFVWTHTQLNYVKRIFAALTKTQMLKPGTVLPERSYDTASPMQIDAVNWTEMRTTSLDELKNELSNLRRVFKQYGIHLR